MTRSKRNNQALFIFLLLCAAYLFVPFHRVSPAVMAVDIMGDMHLGATAMGALASIFFFSYGAMQLPSGLLADSLGPRRTLPFFFGLAGLGAIMFGMSDSVMGLMIGRACMGFGVSVVFICGIKLFSRWFPPEAFARMSGIYLGMGGLGLILGSGPMASLCSAIGWRQGLILSGVVGVVVAVALWFWVRDTPEQAGYESLYPGTGEDSGGQSPAELWQSVREICSSRDFWFIATWFFCQFAIHMSFGGLWGGPFLMDIHHMTKAQAGSVLNMMGIGMLAGGPLTGWLSDSVFRARKPVMLLNALGTVALFIILAMYGSVLPGWAMYVWFFCLAAFGMGSLSVGFASIRDIFGDRATGTGGGLLNTLPSFGVSVFQPLTGWILESHGHAAGGGFTMGGYAMSCALYIGVACVGVCGALLAREPMTRTPVVAPVTE
ncbi:MFS transporter [Pseudodesulfovibrio cashew]|uniref:MFS transporter n=1 Tax=Pseudodesulfovibrio cashew TaxID=2678688 RepID=A0A6I6JVU0_9BACT|nr:MFS transporter [Pseudodesulfovibrio cashew]QGY41834.1 MFS transporter [Pseudodesulfovibrio cashew]